jgi:hypothetical protein
MTLKIGIGKIILAESGGSFVVEVEVEASRVTRRYLARNPGAVILDQ